MNPTAQANLCTWMCTCIANTQYSETSYFRGMILRLIRALQYTKSLPEWDGKNLEVSGKSQGGAFAILGAGIRRTRHRPQPWHRQVVEIICRPFSCCASAFQCIFRTRRCLKTETSELVTVGIDGIACGIAHLPIAVHKAIGSHQRFDLDGKHPSIFDLCRY